MKKGVQPNTLVKAQISAFIGGVFDYVIMVGCTELLHVHYTRSIVISGLVGALVNFSINRYWTYGSNQIAVTSQLIKFYIVVLGSILLKSYGTWWWTEGFFIDYKITRLLVDLVVSIGWNYVLQKYWVFRKEKVYQPE
jgi:putative flippase GtrA